MSRVMMLDISLFINSSEYRYTDYHYLVGVRKLTPTYSTHGKGHLHKPIPEVLVLKYDGLLLLLQLSSQIHFNELQSYVSSILSIKPSVFSAPSAISALKQNIKGLIRKV